MDKVKANHYYIDMDHHLIYVHGPAVVERQKIWRFTCLTTNKTHEMDLASLRQIITKDLGTTIAPAIRLLYSASN